MIAARNCSKILWAERSLVIHTRRIIWVEFGRDIVLLPLKVKVCKIMHAHQHVRVAFPSTVFCFSPPTLLGHTFSVPLYFPESYNINTRTLPILSGVKCLFPIAFSCPFQLSSVH
jgi:hypothetical protein